MKIKIYSTGVKKTNCMDENVFLILRVLSANHLLVDVNKENKNIEVSIAEYGSICKD
jgi:hypothetical protein